MVNHKFLYSRFFIHRCKKCSSFPFSYEAEKFIGNRSARSDSPCPNMRRSFVRDVDRSRTITAEVGLGLRTVRGTARARPFYLTLNGMALLVTLRPGLSPHVHSSLPAAVTVFLPSLPTNLFFFAEFKLAKTCSNPRRVFKWSSKSESHRVL
ncbi:hypothetical protein PIB30_103478 [Stylosanthes scabra]|uniref:Uncharacterized protein n=1 Tax=Stylosanthes scabra TaxID=79078 RepID=A0ABU6WW90_9FABA|nr:hypothetical protein [Stylosanthes scabra]